MQLELGMWNQADSWHSLTSQPSPLDELLASERPCLKNKAVTLRSHSQGCLLFLNSHEHTGKKNYKIKIKTQLLGSYM